MDIFNIVVLSLSGLVLFATGVARITAPITSYQKGSGVTLENEPSLLSEIRGSASVTLSAGVVTLLGAIIPSLAFASFLTAALIFVGFAIGRSINIALHGKPTRIITQGLVSETIFGSLNMFGLIGIGNI